MKVPVIATAHTHPIAGPQCRSKRHQMRAATSAFSQPHAT